MLENLDNIDWQALGRPEIPDLIRGMISLDDATRKESVTTFETQVLYIDNHNLEIGFNEKIPVSELLKSDIQMLTAPFIIEIIKNTDFHDKNRIVGLLNIVAGDFVEYFKYVRPDDYLWKKLAQTRQVIWQGHKVFLSLLEDTQERVRIGGASLLAAYPEHADTTIPHLMKLFQRETERNKIYILWKIDTAFEKQVLKESTKNTLHDELMPCQYPDFTDT